MAKYYIKCGSLELTYSTKKSPIHAAVDVLWETNDNDVLDEYFYVDERGMKDYKTALPDTVVIESNTILDMAGWEQG